MCFKDGSTPLHEAARQEDVATVQALIMSGADVGIKDKNGATPLDLATPDSACRDFLEHHATAFATIDANERELLTAAFIHYGTFSELKDCMPPERLSLRPCHFDPSFVWAPPAARAAVFGYTQSATTIEPFADLPDDCAGDVLDFFDMILPRWIMLFLVTHYSSPGANAWIFEVLTAAIAVRHTHIFWKCHNFRTPFENSSLPKSSTFFIAGQCDGAASACGRTRRLGDSARLPQ